jgi:membrane dipeptidase
MMVHNISNKKYKQTDPMKKISVAFLLLLTVQACKSPTEKKETARSPLEIHEQAILVDTHNDFLTQTMERGVLFDTDLKGHTHSDLSRMKEGGVDVQFFSVWCDGNQVDPFHFALRQMDSLDAVVKRNQNKIEEVKNTTELMQAVGQNKIAAFFGIEGGHMIEDDMGKLDTLYQRGARYMTLTWNNSTSWATSAADETTIEGGTLNSEGKKGLTAFGKKVVEHMNSLGMLVDISHVGEQTFADVIKTTTKPVIASHSSVYGICPVFRNLKDGQIKAIAKNNGVIQINFYSGFIDPNYEKNREGFLQKHKMEFDSLVQRGKSVYVAEEWLFAKHDREAETFRPPLSMVIDHIEYIIKLVGVDFVGLGSDFDGIPSAPKGLDDVNDYIHITEALVERGYGKEDIDKILGGNLLRVLKANEVQ